MKAQCPECGRETLIVAYEHEGYWTLECDSCSARVTTWTYSPEEVRKRQEAQANLAQENFSGGCFVGFGSVVVLIALLLGGHC